MQQIRASCTSKQTGIARKPKLTLRKGETQQRRRDASASGKEKPRQRGSIDKLDYTSRFVCVSSQHSPNTVARLSHNSMGHGLVGVNMVGKGCSSQKNGSDSSIMPLTLEIARQHLRHRRPSGSEVDMVLACGWLGSAVPSKPCYNLPGVTDFTHCNASGFPRCAVSLKSFDIEHRLDKLHVYNMVWVTCLFDLVL